MNQPPPIQPDIIIYGDENEENANIGYRLIGADVNQDGFNDLIIGSPYSYGQNGQANQSSNDTDITFTDRGMVAILIADAITYKQQSELNINDVANWIQRGIHF